MMSNFQRIGAMLLFVITCYGQPGGGNGNGGGHGGGPGNGNGNDPCARPNPPPSCTRVPIQGEVFLIIAGLCIGMVGMKAKKENGDSSKG